MNNIYNLRDLINEYKKNNNKKIAFSLYDGIEHRDISKENYLEDILKVVTYFSKNGTKEKHIGLAMENSYEWLVMFFGIIASKNVVVTLNKELSDRDLQYLCAKADVDYIWCDEELYNTVAPLGIKKLVYSEMIEKNQVDVDDLEDLNGDQVVCLMPTSGSTGQSKFVMLTLDNFYHSTLNMSKLFEYQGKSDYLLTLPLHHAAGLSIALTMLKSCRKLVIGRGMKYIFHDAAALNPKQIITVPLVAESLIKVIKRVKAEDRKKYIGTELKTIVTLGAPLKKESCDYLLEEGFQVENMFGMTEATGVITLCKCDGKNHKSIGKPLFSTQCCMKEDELVLKGPTIMKGYYKDIEATSEVLKDGCLYSGDLGYQSENGEYFLVGRKKNVIILSNGENVNPEEIEMKLGKCEHIQECIVYSDGKGICADIYTLNKESAETFVEEYNDEVPRYHQIYRVNCQETPLEKTGSGKIKRKVNSYE